MRLASLFSLVAILSCGHPASPAPGDGEDARRARTTAPSETASRPDPAPAPTATAVASAASTEAANELPFSPEGVVVPIPALGLTFTVPHPQAGEIYRGARLAELRNCTGEWDKEFSEVADAALSFDTLVAHVGSEPMCKDGALFTDMHVRAYVVPGALAQVLGKIRGDGAAKARTFTIEKQQGRRLSGNDDPKWAPRRNYPGFTHVGLAYPRFYIDYGATAHVDFFAKSFGKNTLVMVIFTTRTPVDLIDGKRVDPFEQVMTSVKPEASATKE